ncbi:MAG: hypothetical protein AAF234_19515 [Pseudomonadota bacterium]
MAHAKKTPLNRLGLFAALGLALAGGVYVGLDHLAGRILGSIVGTTTDPRHPSIRNIRAFTMEPIHFDLFDRRAIARIEAGELEGVDPYFSMVVPAAYIASVITQDFGPRRERDRITSVGIEFLINNDGPFELEQERMMMIVAEDMGLRMLTPDERNYRESRPWPSFPDQATQWRFRGEMERRGIVPVRASFMASLATPEIERRRNVLSSLFNGHIERTPQSAFEPRDGCVVSDGPFLNSVRYDHAPEQLAAVPEELSPVRIADSCLATGARDAFAVIQYNDDGDYLWAMRCADLGPGRVNNCVARFLWGDLRIGRIVVDRAHMLRMPEFIERARALFRSFRNAAEPSTERGA